MYSLRELLSYLSIDTFSLEEIQKLKKGRRISNEKATYTHLLNRIGEIESVLGFEEFYKEFNSIRLKPDIRKKIKDCIEDNSLIDYDIPFAQKKEFEFTFADVYCNIGGATLGLMNEGGRCIFSLESQKKKWSNIYTTNFGMVPYVNPEWIKGDFPKADVLISSLDIQQIPLIQEGKISIDELHDTDYHRLINIINKIQPKAILIESKTTLREEGFEKTVAVVLRTIREATGYYIVNPAILDALNYGVPQRRTRTWFIAFDNPISAMEFQWPRPQKRTWKLKDILDNNPEPRYYISEKHFNFLEEYDEKNKKLGYNFTNSKILDLEGESYSIIYGGKGWDRNIICQPERAPEFLPNGQRCNHKGLRRLTSIELYRLQGFPDEFISLDGWRTAWGYASRATNVKVASAVARAVKLAISEETINKGAKKLIDSGLNFNRR